MKAMIFAAGLGTRLRPLTDHRPKALVEINGRTLLELTLTRLRSYGVREVIVNVHHFTDMVIEYLKANADFGMRVEISREDVLLDTGGGLKKAGHFFVDSRSDEPFIVHNVDVLSTIDLARMLESHRENKCLATLAVQSRKSSRHLLFDRHLQLCGRMVGGGPAQFVRPCQQPLSLAFSGIHIVSPSLVARMSEVGAFPIITSYLRLAAQGERILAFPADEYYWRDLGRPEDIAQATADLRRNVISQ